MVEYDLEGHALSVEAVEARAIGSLSSHPLTVDGVLGTEVGVSSNARNIAICRFVGNQHHCSSSPLAIPVEDDGFTGRRS